MNTPNDASDDTINRLFEELAPIVGGLPLTNAETLASGRVNEQRSEYVLVEIQRDVALALLAEGLAMRGHTIEFGDNGRLRIRENHIGKHNREEWERRFKQRAERMGDYADKCARASK